MLKKISLKRIVSVFLLGLLPVVAGCGSSSGGNSGSTGQTIIVGVSNLPLQIANSSLQISQGTTASATFKKSDGTPAAGIPVNFTSTLGTLTPSNGIVTTDANGTATITLTAGSTSGQGQLTASATIDNKQVTSTGLFSVNLPALHLTNLRFSNNSSASINFGSSVGISVEVRDASENLYTAQPVGVIFNSPAAAQGKSTINSPVATVNGLASTTYSAVTAVGSDTITASISGSSQPIILTITPLSAGSISYISASPLTIGLKGMGGLGIQETSRVTFKVVDTSGAPKPNQPVTFRLNTYLGGLTLTGADAKGVVSGSTGSDGTVSTIVQSGLIATPVRVTAQTLVGGINLSSQSDQLVISTGIPAQDGFSVSSKVLNVEGKEFDGITDLVTVMMSDHFHNPVPDGTAASFTTSCGSIQPSCTTVGGKCSVTWSSQAPRVANGRCTILAYAIGEENFLDVSGEGSADGSCAPPASSNGTGFPTVRTCGEFQDYSEAFRDDNWDNVRNAGETFIDFNGDHVFNGPDGLFNGIFQGAATLAANPDEPKTKHIFLNHKFIVSGSTPVTFAFDSTDIDPAEAICSDPPACTSTKVLPVITPRILSLRDANGNPMPTGTTVAVNGLAASPASAVVPDGVPVDPKGLLVTPNDSDTFVFTFTATTTGGGSPVTVTVKTPQGITTAQTFNFSW